MSSVDQQPQLRNQTPSAKEKTQVGREEGSVTEPLLEPFLPFFMLCCHCTLPIPAPGCRGEALEIRAQVPKPERLSFPTPALLLTSCLALSDGDLPVFS